MSMGLDPLTNIPDFEELLLGQYLNGAPPPVEFQPRPQPQFLDRLAMAFQNLPAIQPSNDLQGGILGALQGFGQARGGAFQQQQADVEAANKRISEGARLMAQQRWQKYQADSQYLRGVREQQRAQAQADRDAKRDELTARGIKVNEDRLTETERHNKEMEKLGLTRATGDRAVDDTTIPSVAQAAASGQFNSMSEVPAGKNGAYRGAVVKYMADNGLSFTPKKVRDATADIEVGRGLIAEFKRMSEKVNRGSGVGRFGAGLQNVAGQLTQAADPDIANYPDTRKGLSSYISRLSGQTGVLTDRDVAVATALIPSQWDSREAATNKLDRLSGFLESKFEAFKKAHTTPNLGAATPGGKVSMVAPDGRPLSVPADKVAEMEAKGARRR